MSDRFKLAVVSCDPQGLIGGSQVPFDLFPPKNISRIHPAQYDLVLIDARPGHEVPASDGISKHLAGTNIMFLSETFDIQKHCVKKSLPCARYSTHRRISSSCWIKKRISGLQHPFLIEMEKDRSKQRDSALGYPAQTGHRDP